MVFREARQELRNLDHFLDKDLDDQWIEAIVYQADDPSELHPKIYRLLVRSMNQRAIHLWEVRYLFECNERSASKILDELTDRYPELLTCHCPLCGHQLVCRDNLHLG